MPRLPRKRLQAKYPGFFSPSGDVTDYRGLMAEIVADNNQAVQNAVGRLQVSHFSDATRRIKASTTLQVAVPSLEDVLPKRSVFLRKGAERGRLLSDTLRTKLTSDLRDAVSQYLTPGGESGQYKQGERRGELKPEMVSALREKMTQTFQDYTKPGATGVPKNIQAIATTEIRSAVDEIKHAWATRLEEQNAGRVHIIKKWRHHPSLSKTPRWWHHELDGVERPLSIPFTVKNWKKTGNGWYWQEVNYMQHPHDSTAPAEQVINCSCECDYVVRFL